jgi:ectoine hydroxylase-related dioxygenase (phytanoyl-CoA dioxygenase family)
MLRAADVDAHGLTDEERKQFEEDGFFVVASALDPRTVEALRAIADGHLDRLRANGASEHAYLNLHDLVGRDPLFLDLMTWPTVFHKVWQVLGWNIQLFHTQLVVTPTSDPALPAGPDGWHQDNHRMNMELEVELMPRISMKVGYFLADVPEPGMGNFCVIPGSHLTRRPDETTGIQITANAGDAVVFDRRLWHSGSTNQSPVTRRALFYGYSYRWLRPKSAMRVTTLPMYEQLDPIERQLLGACSTANGYYTPDDTTDAPLRKWIADHVGTDAVAP